MFYDRPRNLTSLSGEAPEVVDAVDMVVADGEFSLAEQFISQSRALF